MQSKNPPQNWNAPISYCYLFVGAVYFRLITSVCCQNVSSDLLVRVNLKYCIHLGETVFFFLGLMKCT